MKIILASGSPRRIQLLKEWGLTFTVRPSGASEETPLVRPSAIVTSLALRKAMSVAKDASEGLVIGADTIVVLRGDIIGKPEDTADALRILSELNASWHRVYTGIAVVDAATGRSRAGYEVSRVKTRRFSEQELRLLAGKHMDKAGAYAVQEKDDAFVERIEGDYFNVVGLPCGLLRQLLTPFNIRLQKAGGGRHVPSRALARRAR